MLAVIMSHCNPDACAPRDTMLGSVMRHRIGEAITVPRYTLAVKRTGCRPDATWPHARYVKCWCAGYWPCVANIMSTSVWLALPCMLGSCPAPV